MSVTIALTSGDWIITDGAASITLTDTRGRDWTLRGLTEDGIPAIRKLDDGKFQMVVKLAGRRGDTFIEYDISAAGVVEARGTALTGFALLQREELYGVDLDGANGAGFTAGTVLADDSAIDVVNLNGGGVNDVAIGLDLGAGSELALTTPSGVRWDPPAGASIIGARALGDGYTVMVETATGFLEYAVSAEGVVATTPTALSAAEVAALAEDYGGLEGVTAFEAEKVSRGGETGAADDGVAIWTTAEGFEIRDDGISTALTTSRGQAWSPTGESATPVAVREDGTGYRIVVESGSVGAKVYTEFLVSDAGVVGAATPLNLLTLFAAEVAYEVDINDDAETGFPTGVATDRNDNGLEIRQPDADTAAYWGVDDTGKLALLTSAGDIWTPVGGGKPVAAREDGDDYRIVVETGSGATATYTEFLVSGSGTVASSGTAIPEADLAAFEALYSADIDDDGTIGFTLGARTDRLAEGQEAPEIGVFLLDGGGVAIDTNLDDASGILRLVTATGAAYAPPAGSTIVGVRADGDAYKIVVESGAGSAGTVRSYQELDVSAEGVVTLPGRSVSQVELIALEGLYQNDLNGDDALGLVLNDEDRIDRGLVANGDQLFSVVTPTGVSGVAVKSDAALVPITTALGTLWQPAPGSAAVGVRQDGSDFLIVVESTVVGGKAYTEFAVSAAGVIASTGTAVTGQIGTLEETYRADLDGDREVFFATVDNTFQTDADDPFTSKPADGKTLVISSDGSAVVKSFATIQAAVDAASAGDTIVVAAGSYNESVTVNKDVTILGAQAGVAGTDAARGTGESVLTGGFEFSGDGATVDGFKVLQGAVFGGQPAGVYVRADTVTITNMVMDGTGGTNMRGVVTATGTSDGLTITNSVLTNFLTGVYLNPGSENVTISGNAFSSNTISIANDGLDSTDTYSGNTFEQRVSGVTEGSIDGSAVIFDNTFTNGAAEDVRIAYTGSSSVTITGTDNDDVLRGGTADDTLTGGEGGDLLQGRGGVDTAGYSTSITASMIASSAADLDPNAAGDQPGWVVTTGGAEGTDRLVGISVVDGAEAGKFLLVGNGGFTTIQAAVDAASDGDTILIAAGNYSAEGKILIKDKSLTVEGALAGESPVGDNWADQAVGSETVIDGFTLTGTGGLILDGVRLLGTGPESGNGLSGIQAYSSGDLTVRNSVIQTDGTAEAGLAFSPAGIDVSRRDGDITVDNVLFTAFKAPDTDKVSDKDNAYGIFLNYGDQVTNRDVSVTNSKFDLGGNGGNFLFPKAISTDGRTGGEGSFIVQDNEILNTSPAPAFQHFDFAGRLQDDANNDVPGGGAVDFSGVSGNTFTNAIGTLGNAGILDNFSGFDIKLGANTVDGLAYGSVIAGTAAGDAIAATAGNDLIHGDDGNDTVIYAGARAGYEITRNTDGTFTVTDSDDTDGDSGTDTLSKVESVTIGGIVYELNGNAPATSGYTQKFGQGFETSTDGFRTGPTAWSGALTVVADGTDGIPAADGGFYAIAEQTSEAGGLTGPFTRFDGYRSEFGPWAVELKVWLDPAWADGEGFDWSVAATGQDGNHQRDFIFHVTKDADTGTVLVGADNNSNFNPQNNLETKNHVSIDTAGWYTLEHNFYENALGDLEVAMSVYDASGSWLFSEIRTDASDDIATEVGGNRYGWFTNIDIDGGIAIDSVVLKTESANTIQTRDGNTITGEYATVADALAAVKVGEVVLDPATRTFHVAEGMSIQDAIDAARAGDTVSVGAGTFTENLVIDKALTLAGSQSGNVAETVAREGGETTINGSGTFGITVLADDVTIDGVEVTGFARDGINVRTLEAPDPDDNTVGAHRDGVTIANSWIHDDAASGQRNGVLVGEFSGDPARSTEDAKVEDLVITGNVIDLASTGARALAFTNHFNFITFTDTVISNNEISSGNAAWFSGANTATFRFDGAQVTGNTVTSGTVNTYNLFDASIDDNTFNGIVLVGVDESTISNNVFNVADFYGLGLWGDEFGTNVSQNSVISGNSFTYNQDATSGTYEGAILFRPGADAASFDIESNTFTDGGFNPGLPVADIILRGTSGDDTLDVAVLTDSLGAPFTGTVQLVGNDGNDLLIGGPGDDILAGGAGSDTFVFVGPDTGADTILDFEGAGVAGGDVLGVGGLNGVAAFEDLSIAVVGEDTVITAADPADFAGSITVLGVTGLTADDFVFGSST